MRAELRDRLGKAAFAVRRAKSGWALTWEESTEERREAYRQEAEAVARELLSILARTLQGDADANPVGLD
jgi:hypothetical protein